jgi:hypothetical protein
VPTYLIPDGSGVTFTADDADDALVATFLGKHPGYSDVISTCDVHKGLPSFRHYREVSVDEVAVMKIMEE